MFAESVVRVCADPVVDLFVAETAGPAERTVLVIHGGPDWDGSYLRRPLDELGGEYRVLLPDLRGCGGSTRGLAEDRYSWDLAVADLLALLDIRDVGAVDVIGHSTGGKIAQRLALAAPERVRRLVVASSNVLPVPPNAFAGWRERDRRLDASARLADAAREARPDGPDAADTTGAGASAVDPSAAAPSTADTTAVDLVRTWAFGSAPANVWREDRLDEYLRRLRAVNFSGEWVRPYEAGSLPAALPENAAERLAESGIPLLLLHGRQDMTFPASLAEEAAARIPAAEAVVLDRAGHMAHIDQPERWTAAIREFLA